MPQQEEEEKVGTFLYYQERMGGNEVVDKQKKRERQLYFDMETICLPFLLPCFNLPSSVLFSLHHPLIFFFTLFFLLQGIQISTLKFPGWGKLFLKFLRCCFSICPKVHSRPAYKKVHTHTHTHTRYVSILAAYIIDIWWCNILRRDVLSLHLHLLF